MGEKKVCRRKWTDRKGVTSPYLHCTLIFLIFLDPVLCFTLQCFRASGHLKLLFSRYPHMWVRFTQTHTVCITVWTQCVCVSVWEKKKERLHQSKAGVWLGCLSALSWRNWVPEFPTLVLRGDVSSGCKIWQYVSEGCAVRCDMKSVCVRLCGCCPSWHTGCLPSDLPTYSGKYEKVCVCVKDREGETVYVCVHACFFLPILYVHVYIGESLRYCI